MKSKTREFLYAVALPALCLASASAQAVVISTANVVTVTEVVPGGSWTYSVGGWDGGGSVTGSFTGSDVDSDGQLNSFSSSGEVTGFTMAYSGGTIVGALSFTYLDLQGLIYDLDGSLGDGVDEGIFAFDIDTQFFIGEGLSGFACGLGSDCGSIYGPAPTVPEPATLALLGLGLLGLGVTRRKAN